MSERQELQGIKAPDLQQLFINNNVEFATLLYTIIIKRLPHENIIFSPLSIQTCAGLAYAGSTGLTSKQLAQGLKFPENDRNTIGELFKILLKKYTDESTLKIANKIYLSERFKINGDFGKFLSQWFYSEVENVNFSHSVETVKHINDWVKRVTCNKIESIISEDDCADDTSAILMNAVYFKGAWEIPFNSAGKHEFWTSENKSELVEMMKIRDNFNFEFNEELDAQIVELKYQNSDLSMLIFLPEKRNSLDKLEEKLATFDLLTLENNDSVKLDILLPKFQIVISTDLKEIFNEMGMPLLFSKEAEFDYITANGQKVFFDTGIHKAFIEVNEKGTEAAGVTGKFMFLSEPISFTANHPFFFVIKSESGILFMGRYVKP